MLKAASDMDVERFGDFLRSLVELGSWEPLTKLKLEELVLQLKSCEAITDEAKQSLPLRLQLEIVGDDEMRKRIELR